MWALQQTPPPPLQCTDPPSPLTGSPQKSVLHDGANKPLHLLQIWQGRERERGGGLPEFGGMSQQQVTTIQNKEAVVLNDTLSWATLRGRSSTPYPRLHSEAGAHQCHPLTTPILGHMQRQGLICVTPPSHTHSRLHSEAGAHPCHPP